jgi:DNA repair protein RadC
MKEKKPHYLGHRERLKARFDDLGAKGLADYEVMELLLTYAIPRRDIKPIAKALLAKFATLSGVLGAKPDELTAIEGIGPGAAQYFKVLEAAVIRYRKEAVRERPAFQNRLDLLEYLHAKLGNLTREEFHVVFLDAKHQILADDCLFTGTVNASAVYPREVVKAALDKGAVGLVLAHNHPSGQPGPSAADEDLTALLVAATAPIGITIHDHIIIGDGRHFSFRDAGKM